MKKALEAMEDRLNIMVSANRLLQERYDKLVDVVTRQHSRIVKLEDVSAYPRPHSNDQQRNGVER